MFGSLTDLVYMKGRKKNNNNNNKKQQQQP